MYTITTISIISLVALLVERKKSNIWKVGKGYIYIQQNLIPFDRKGQRGPLPICKALTWNSDGKILFRVYDDESIRMWKQSEEKGLWLLLEAGPLMNNHPHASNPIEDLS